MISKTDVWAKSCLVDTVLDSLQKEIVRLNDDSVYSPKAQALLKKAYRDACGLSAALNTLETMMGE